MECPMTPPRADCLDASTVNTPDSREEDVMIDSKSARKALIEEGRRRMEEFRKRSGSSPPVFQNESYSSPSRSNQKEDVFDDEAKIGFTPAPKTKPNGTVGHLHGGNDPTTYTPVARGLNHQLEKLKRDELDLAAAEWSEQKKNFTQMARAFEQEIDMLNERLDGERSAKERVVMELEREKESHVALQQRHAEELSTTSSLREKVQKLATELENRARENVNRISSLSERDADIAALTKRVAELESDNASMKNAFDQTSRSSKEELMTIQGQLDEAQNKVGSLTRSVRAQQDELKSFKEKNDMLETKNAQMLKEIDRCNHDLNKSKRQVALLESEKRDIQENLNIALENNRRLTSEEKQGAKARQEHVAALERDLNKAIATAKQEQETNAELRQAIQDKLDMITFLESKIEEKSTNSQSAKQLKVDMDALKREHKALKAKLGEYKTILAEKDQRLQEEENLRRAAEEASMESKREHEKALQEQEQEFMKILKAQQDSEQELRLQQEKSSLEEQQTFQDMEREIASLRERVMMQKPLPLEDQQQQEPIMEQLLVRVGALEKAFHDKRSPRQHTDLTLREKEHTIHQLTLEVEEGKRTFDKMRKKLSRSGLCTTTAQVEDLDLQSMLDSTYPTDVENDSGYSTEEGENVGGSSKWRDQIRRLKRKLKHAELKRVEEAKARQLAESKNAFLQSEFTDLFVQYLATRDKKKIAKKPALTNGNAKRRTRSKSRPRIKK